MNGHETVDPRPEPQVSVVIPCHNSATTIGLQLQALSQQVDAPVFEVVLVDNRSADNLAAVAEQWRDALDLRVVRAPSMPNPGYARNVGVAHARAPVLAFCDSDDYVCRRWVRVAADAANRTPVTNGGATPVDETQFALGLDHLDGLLDGNDAAEAIDVPESPIDYPILLGGSCVLRSDAYRAVGGYDVSTPYGIEDNDLALRLQQAGYVIARANAMKLAYRIRSDGDGSVSRAFRSGYRHLLLAHRHHLFGRSPSLPPRWYLGLGRCGLAAVRMLLRPGTRDWRNLERRAALHAGMLVGHARYGLLGRPPSPRPGVGLGG